MRMPTALKSLDDKVLGRSHRSDADEPYPDEPRAGETRTIERHDHGRPRPGTGEGLREFLAVLYRASKVVFLALAAVLLLGTVFVLAPTNADNSIVSFVADLADGAAGPFRDVFTVSDDAERELVVNYGFAAAVYLVLGLLVTKLPGAKR